MTEHGYTISSLCEHNGSGELNQRTNGPVNAHLRPINLFDYKGHLHELGQGQNTRWG